MFWREKLSVDTGVETENTFLGGIGRSSSDLHSLHGIECRILSFAYLYGCTAAVPAVGRIVIAPEVIRRRERYAVQRAVLLADVVVAGGPVLQVVPVAVLRYFGPGGGHLRGAYGEIVLRFQIAHVVVCVDAPNVCQESGEAFYRTVFLLNLGFLFQPSGLLCLLLKRLIVHLFHCKISGNCYQLITQLSVTVNDISMLISIQRF